MAFTPVAGQTAIIRTVVGNTNTSLAAINWTLTIDSKAKDVSNFRDGRFRVKTLQDSTLNFTVVHDAGAPEYLSANGSLIDGQVMTAYCYTNAAVNTAFTVPCIVMTVGPKNEGVEGVVMYDVTAAQHNGTITYPTA
jgi:hypothetical protein